MRATATCPQASAPIPSHSSRRGTVEVCRNPLAATSTNGVQASVPANGSEIATDDAPTIMPNDSPPTVAAVRARCSFRRNQYTPSPPISGLSTIRNRSAVVQENVENSAIGAAYSQPDWGSLAYGMPAI